MIIDGGLTLFLFGILLAIAAPLERSFAERRWHRSEIVARVPIMKAFPVVPPSPALDELAREAEAALDEDDLARGVRQVSAIYDNSAND